MKRRSIIYVVTLVIAIAAFALGRASVSDGILSSSRKPSPSIAQFDRGALAPEAHRDALAGVPDPKQRRGTPTAGTPTESNSRDAVKEATDDT